MKTELLKSLLKKSLSSAFPQNPFALYASLSQVATDYLSWVPMSPVFQLGLDSGRHWWKVRGWEKERVSDVQGRGEEGWG